MVPIIDIIDVWPVLLANESAANAAAILPQSVHSHNVVVYGLEH